VFKENPEKYNWAVDTYSFAMTSYEIVSGKHPFWDVPTVTYDRLCTGERPCLPVNCQQKLANLIQRCWATNPDERPNIFEVCDELQSCKEALLRRKLVWRNASGSLCNHRLTRRSAAETHLLGGQPFVPQLHIHIVC